MCVGWTELCFGRRRSPQTSPKRNPQTGRRPQLTTSSSGVFIHSSNGLAPTMSSNYQFGFGDNTWFINVCNGIVLHTERTWMKSNSVQSSQLLENSGVRFHTLTVLHLLASLTKYFLIFFNFRYLFFFL